MGLALSRFGSELTFDKLGAGTEGGGGLTQHIKNDKLGMHSIGGRLVLRGVVLSVSKICTRIALHEKDTVSLQENHVTHVVSDFQRGCFHEFRFCYAWFAI